ncbi:MAG: cupin domain-containing protein [Gammaproteobacteria bacterium]|nr:cupin domain-containing protein [Gammaproteobacteria bacterium]
MKNKITKTLFLTLSVITSLLSVHAAQLQMTGVSVTPLESFELKHQVPSMEGYNIRTRKIVVEAGGTIGEHHHKIRPGIVYVESGEIVEYRGKNSRLLKPGDSLVEDATTVHSYKNTSDKPCVLIAFDLPVVE